MNASSPLSVFRKIAPHRLMRGFLGDEMVEQLLQYAAANEGAFQQTKVGPTGMRHVAENMRISRVLHDLGPLRETLEERFRAVMEEAVRELGLPPIDLAALEIELVAHGDGNFYKRHIDTSTTQINARSDRALTGVYYFHQLPQEYSGGALRLHSILPVEQGGQFIDILPERDMLLLFPSWAPHEVRPISCPSGGFAQSRFALNCWYRHRRKAVPVSSSAAVPAQLAVNPFASVTRRRDIDSAYLEIDSYAAASGFTRKLLRDGDPGFDDALRLLETPEDAEPVLAEASPDALRSLWRFGLLVAVDQRVDLVLPKAFALSHDCYAKDGFALIADCLAPAARQAAVAHYRQAVANGKMRRGDRLSDRYVAHNDPVGRVFQQAAREAVERIVGHPIKSSYTYASLYCGGTELPIHTDREQCQHTMSVLLDLSPMPDDGLSPWALMVHAHPDAPPVECRQSVGGALLFRGCEIPHSRPPLPPDHTCWVLLLHYVDADFVGSLD